jgi:double-stranded uracil-DNA glycosylase
MPGVKSLQANEYYAHKGNTFWRIMGELVGAGSETPYSERVGILNNKGVAVWDVLKSCIRPGSLDVDIRDEEPNDFQIFFGQHPKIEKIGLNGTKAAACFKKYARTTVPAKITCVTLPSTSPANASLPFSEKLDAWRALLFI